MRGKRPIRIQYWRAEDHQFYFHIVASNNRIIAQSEGYLKKTACLKTIAILMQDGWELEEV